MLWCIKNFDSLALVVIGEIPLKKKPSEMSNLHNNRRYINSSILLGKSEDTRSQTLELIFTSLAHLA